MTKTWVAVTMQCENIRLWWSAPHLRTCTGLGRSLSCKDQDWSSGKGERPEHAFLRHKSGTNPHILQCKGMERKLPFEGSTPGHSLTGNKWYGLLSCAPKAGRNNCPPKTEGPSPSKGRWSEHVSCKGRRPEPGQGPEVKAQTILEGAARNEGFAFHIE